MKKICLLLCLTSPTLLFDCSSDDPTNTDTDPIDIDDLGDEITCTTYMPSSSEFKSITSDTIKFLIDTLIIPLDTLELYDQIEVKAPDSIFLINIENLELRDTVIATSVVLNTIDSISFSVPDSIFLFETLNEPEITIEERIDPVTNSNIEICPDAIDAEIYQNVNTIIDFITYLVGNWKSESVNCEIDEEAFSFTDDFTNFSIRFDFQSISNTQIVISYLSRFGQPVFEESGTLTILSSEDFTSDIIAVNLDNEKALSFVNLNENLNSQELEFTVEDGFDCGDEGGRTDRLGRSRFKCKRF